MTDGTLRRQHRYTVLPEPLIRDKRVSDRAMRLWCLLDRYAGANGQAFPKRKTLADALDCSVATLDRAMDELVETGWLSKARREAGGVNDYTLLDGSEGVLMSEDTPTREDTVSSPVTTPLLTSEQTQKEASPTTHQGSDADGSLRSPSPEPSPPTVDEEFERFYAEYPRKVGRGQAVKAYRTARKKASAQEILDGLMKALPGLLSTRDRKFIPHPATWLNGERWADDESGVGLSPHQPPIDHDYREQAASLF